MIPSYIKRGECIVETIVSSLGGKYRLTDVRRKEDTIALFIESTQTILKCPYCGAETSKVHSYHTREIQDLPISDHKTVLIVTTRKMQCMNPECNHRFFSEQHVFAAKNAQKTKRLVDRILKTSTEVSSVCSSRLLKNEKITVGKSSICSMLKKNATHCG